MAQRLRNNAEGGTNGALATTANTGGNSGTAANNFPGTVAPTFTSTNAINGAYSYQFSAASGSTCIWEWSPSPIPAGTVVGYRVSINAVSLPSQATEIIQLRPASGVSVRVFLAASGKIQVNDASNTSVYISTNAITANTPYNIVVKMIAGTSTTNGSIYLSVQNIGTGNYLETPFALNGTANAGTSAISLVRFGKLTATTWSTSFIMDTPTLDDTAPWSGAPIINAGDGQTVASGAAVTLSGTSSAAYDVALPTFAWTLVSGPAATLSNGTTLTPSYTAPSTSGTEVWRLTATDSANNSSTDTVSIVVGSAAANTPLVLSLNYAGPAYVVDARGSTGNTSSGPLQYEADYLSGAHLTQYQVVPGFFVFIADDTDDGEYNIVVSTLDGTSSQAQHITLPAVNPTATTAPGQTSVNETVRLVSGSWV